MRDRINIPALVNLWVPVLCLALATGCTREEAIDGPESGTQSEIHFFTSTQTRAGGSGLATSAKVRIYPYHQKTGVTAPIIADGKEYAADATNGTTLNPAGMEAKNMVLPAGTFRFYAVSTNSTTVVPMFDTVADGGYPTNGSSNSTTALANGIDYLHTVAVKEIQFGKGQDIALDFKHAGTQVQLTIQFGETACAESPDAAAGFAEADVWVQQTNVTGAYMYLNDGQIRLGNHVGLPPLPCETSGQPDESKMAKMAVKKDGTPAAGSAIPANQVATYTMLPLAKSESGSQKMAVKVVIKNLKVGTEVATTHTYTGLLEASAGWNPGESNRYTLILKGNEIQFSNVTVADWETGTTGMVGNVTDNSSSTTP